MAERIERRCEEDPTLIIDHENQDQTAPSEEYYDDFCDPAQGKDPIKPMSDVYVQSLDAAKHMLQKKVLVGNILPKLHKSKGGFLDDVERAKVESGGSNRTKMHILLEILKTKDDAALTTFCKVLQDLKYVEAAEKLKKEIASRGHSSSLDDCPSEIELDKVSKNVGGQWKSLLVRLGVPASKIESSFQDNLGKTQPTCFDSLVFWQKGNEPCRPATWSVLLDALEKGAEMKEYADRRRSELLSLETSCQTGPEATHKILKEKKVAYSLHPVIEKLGKPFSTVQGEFRKEVRSLSDDLYDEVVALCQTTMATKAHVSRLPDVPSHDRKDFIDHIIKHTTLFDIELIHEVANLLHQPTLTEAVVRYEADLEPLMRTSITELTDRCEVMPVNKDTPEGTYRLVLKFPDDANVRDLCEAKHYFDKVLHIPDAKLLAFDHGCILVYFEITCTPDILKDLPKRFTKHSDQLEAMGISGAFLIDHWAWGADSDDVWYTDDESDDMEVNDQQGFLGNRKRSHLGSVSGGCAEIVSSKKASHLKESCPSEKESGDRQGTAEEDCCIQLPHPPLPRTEEGTSQRSESVFQTKNLKVDLLCRYEQLQTPLLHGMWMTLAVDLGVPVMDLTPRQLTPRRRWTEQKCILQYKTRSDSVLKEAAIVLPNWCGTDGDCRESDCYYQTNLRSSKLLKLSSGGISSTQPALRRLARKRRNRLKAISSSAQSLNCHHRKSQRTIHTSRTSHTSSLPSLAQPQTSSVQSDPTDEVESTRMDQTDSGFSNDQ